MAPLRGDPGRLRQVILNLTSNAIKFTADGSVAIVAELVDRRDATLTTRVSVHDTGPGLSPDARSKLFEKFVQEDASVTRRFGGTGLGLAICKQLVGLLGGEIGVDSTEGIGSTFWFTVPLVSPQTGLANGRGSAMARCARSWSVSAIFRARSWPTN